MQERKNAGLSEFIAKWEEVVILLHSSLLALCRCIFKSVHKTEKILTVKTMDYIWPHYSAGVAHVSMRVTSCLCKYFLQWKDTPCPGRECGLSVSVECSLVILTSGGS